jgi:hypothetical protein
MNDVTYRDEGTVILFTLWTDEAQAFVHENVEVEDWQWMGPHSFAANRRPSIALVEMLRDEGFIVMEVR